MAVGQWIEEELWLNWRWGWSSALWLHVNDLMFSPIAYVRHSAYKAFIVLLDVRLSTREVPLPYLFSRLLPRLSFISSHPPDRSIARLGNHHMDLIDNQDFDASIMTTNDCCYGCVEISCANSYWSVFAAFPTTITFAVNGVITVVTCQFPDSFPRF